MKKLILGLGYWIFQLTWGIIMTLIGLVATIVLLPGNGGSTHFHRNGFGLIIEVGGNWGGLNLGPISLCGTYGQKDSRFYDEEWFNETRRHEFGHSLQNIILGPLYPFLVAIPSAVRYWYNRIARSKGITFTDSWYDCKAWFEYTASLWGTDTINKLENSDFPYKYRGCYCGIFAKKK